jgi:8-oxo-dGTP pyrophosphatase MutT (NUDIX family)
VRKDGQTDGGQEEKLTPWTVTASKYLLKDKWLTVRADQCRTARGITVSPYYVLEYPDWVQVVAFDSDYRILITQQYRHAMNSICLELPCGTVEATDETPLAAAKREMLEETGCISDRFDLIGSLSPNPATHTNTIHCFVAYDVHRSQQVRQDESEEVSSSFMEVEDVMAAIEAGEFAQALHVCALLLAMKHVGFMAVSNKPKCRPPNKS